MLTYTTPTDPTFQSQLEAIDTRLQARFNMTAATRPEGGGPVTACGVLDLNTGKLALIRPDRIDYAASVPKIGILLAYFDKHPTPPHDLTPERRHQLGLMAKASDNEMASKFSHELGLKNIQEVLNRYGFYDPAHGGGIWVGKHYGKDSERYGDPLSNNSHAATVRQLLRYWLMLEQGQLVSPEVSQTMRDLFASPDIPHDNIKFVKALAPRVGQNNIVRKWGSWENWLLDTAVITGGGRHYILVAMTQHPKGDDYLESLATEVDDLLAPPK